MFWNTKVFTIFGVPSQQSFADLAAWELFLRNKHVNSIIELGTGRGGMTLYFLLWAMQQNATFSTFDITRHKNLESSRLAKKFHLLDHFKEVDVLSQYKTVLKSIIHPTLIYCDNGNKPEEVRLYSKHLAPGDFIVVHDFNIEINQGDLVGLPISEIMPEPEGYEFESLTKFFVIVGNDDDQ